jgi:Pyridoxamine 5'-phosphate oxidase
MSTPEPAVSRPELVGYGILPADEGDGLLPFSWAEERLTASRSYWIATSRPEGRPHLAPVWGLWLERQMFFSSGRDSVKARNLAATAQVVVATDNPDEAVIVEGTATELDRADPLFGRFNAAYLAKYDVDVSAMDGPVYCVPPAKVFAFDERNFVGSATRWVFSASS